jgi:hypothetical protein
MGADFKLFGINDNLNRNNNEGKEILDVLEDFIGNCRSSSKNGN